VNRALDGPDATTTALTSLHRLGDLALSYAAALARADPTDPGAAFTTALRRAQRRVDDPDGMVWHAARRIFAFAPMIRDGIHVDEAEPHLHARACFTDTARLLGTTHGRLAAELIDTMLRSGAITIHDKRLQATADHAGVPAKRWFRFAAVSDCDAAASRGPCRGRGHHCLAIRLHHLVDDMAARGRCGRSNALMAAAISTTSAGHPRPGTALASSKPRRS
jgi:hypothetical protein